LLSIEWETLLAELEAVAAAAGAFNAHVLDALDNHWCAARGFSEAPREDLADFVHEAESRTGIALDRGGKLDVACRDGWVRVRAELGFLLRPTSPVFRAGRRVGGAGLR
jgi:hypothetical protein